MSVCLCVRVCLSLSLSLSPFLYGMVLVDIYIIYIDYTYQHHTGVCVHYMFVLKYENTSEQ